MVHVPHDAWAGVHDWVHRESFGEALDNLTAATLALVEEVLEPAGAVLDIGAGTGRIAIPLAARGHPVTVVEPSAAMLEVLRRRAADEGVEVDVQVATAQEFEPVPGQALAMAVFTVMNYLLDQAALAALAERVAKSLIPGGSFVFDLADRQLFGDCDYESERMLRQVRMTPVAGADSLFEYREECRGECDGEPFAYTEELKLRFWSAEEVLPVFEAAGLAFAADHSDELLGSGGRYLRVRKRNR